MKLLTCVKYLYFRKFLYLQNDIFTQKIYICDYTKYNVVNLTFGETGEKIYMANKKIMIVDDDADVLTTVEQLLKSKGHTVIPLNDGHDCFKKLKNGERPNLIILDIMMPVMSGWEIQRRLEENPDWCKIPIVFLTGRSTKTAEEMCKKYGIDYIQKPFDVKELQERIQKVLMKRKNN